MTIDIDAELARIKRERLAREARNGNGGANTNWPDPRPIVEALLPVATFKSEFVPASLGPWIEDIGDRLQCPPDYVAVAAITALGAVIGRRVGIKPQLKTDWVEFPNVWGCFIGRPGALKSPAMGEALKPIHRLEAEAAKDNALAQEAYAAGLDAFKLRKQVFASLTKESMKSKKKTDIDVAFDLGEEPKAPIPTRFRTNDSSYESLGELLIGNPTGILVERDELVSLLQHLDRDEQCVAKGFYLSGWGGSQPYTFDRIGRGHRHIDAVCLSVLGNTQPARIAEYVHQSNKGGAGGDGLLQRFGLLVWPDAPATWHDVDEYPITSARENALEVLTRLSKLDTSAALRAGAEMDAFDKVPSFRFDFDAHAEFLAWRGDLEAKLRRGDLSAALEGHIAKYRKLVPALALITHLADREADLVGLSSLKRAIGFAEYLETHARRLYGSGSEIETAAAKAISRHIHKGDLTDGFTARDVHRPRWSGLTDSAHVELGLTMLVDLDHLAASPVPPGERGGRPTTTYKINPKGMPN
jgi:putative DNA primase/helicase